LKLLLVSKVFFYILITNYKIYD